MRHSARSIRGMERCSFGGRVSFRLGTSYSVRESSLEKEEEIVVMRQSGREVSVTVAPTNCRVIGDG